MIQSLFVFDYLVFAMSGEPHRCCLRRRVSATPGLGRARGSNGDRQLWATLERM